MMDIAPITIATLGYIFKSCLMLNPINKAEIPKNNKLNPTITEINPAENIGNIIKINPKIIDNIPTPLLKSI